MQCVANDFYLLFKMLYGKIVLCFVNITIIIQFNYPLLIYLYMKKFKAMFIFYLFYFILHHHWVPAQAQLKHFIESQKCPEMVLKALYSTGDVDRLTVALQIF